MGGVLTDVVIVLVTGAAAAAAAAAVAGSVACYLIFGCPSDASTLEPLNPAFGPAVVQNSWSGRCRTRMTAAKTSAASVSRKLLPVSHPCLRIGATAPVAGAGWVYPVARGCGVGGGGGVNRPTTSRIRPKGRSLTSASLAVTRESWVGRSPHRTPRAEGSCVWIPGHDHVRLFCSTGRAGALSVSSSLRRGRRVTRAGTMSGNDGGGGVGGSGSTGAGGGAAGTGACIMVPTAETSHEIEKIKGSRFIATIAPAVDVEAALAVVARVKTEVHPAARHWCWAWRGDDENAFRYADDGEPSGTAGKPILAQIDGRGLSNAVVVVTRYFGGIKLGTGGLVRAYGGAAKHGVEEAAVETIPRMKVITLRFPYDVDGAVRSEMQLYGCSVVDAAYTDVVTLRVGVPKEAVDDFVRNVSERSAGRCRVDLSEPVD